MDIKKKITEVSNAFNAQLPKGLFLNARSGDKDNTMTIGWGSIGIMWGKPVLTVMVRYSRYTYELLKESKVFTVSVPEYNGMKEELSICGSNSGRDMDKFKQCNITKKQGKKVNAPVIGECDLQFECKILYKQAMEPGLLDTNIDDASYKNHDYHVYFTGEIVECY